MEAPKTGWFEYHVIETLRLQNEKMDAMDAKLTDVTSQIATLKERARNWGAVAGFIVAVAGQWAMKKLGIA